MYHLHRDTLCDVNSGHIVSFKVRSVTSCAHSLLFGRLHNHMKLFFRCEELEAVNK